MPQNQLLVKRQLDRPLIETMESNGTLGSTWDDVVGEARSFVYGALVSSWFLVGFVLWTVVRMRLPGLFTWFPMNILDHIMQIGAAGFTVLLFLMGPKESATAYWTMITITTALGGMIFYLGLTTAFLVMRRGLSGAPWKVCIGPYRCLVFNSKVIGVSVIPSEVLTTLSTNELGQLVTVLQGGVLPPMPGDVSKGSLLAYKGCDRYYFRKIADCKIGQGTYDLLTREPVTAGLALVNGATKKAV